MVLEPVAQGAGGMWLYSPRYLQRVRQLCDREGVLLTGLLYIDEKKQDLNTTLNLVDTPLWALKEGDLRPSKETLEQIAKTSPGLSDQFLNWVGYTTPTMAQFNGLAQSAVDKFRPATSGSTAEMGDPSQRALRATLAPAPGESAAFANLWIAAGAADMMGPAMVVLLAGGVSAIMNNTQTMGTILHSMEQMVSGASAGLAERSLIVPRERGRT